jgi:hypothetical protein
MDFTHTRVFRIASLAIALGLLSGLAPELDAQGRHDERECSAATLEGSYGFYRTGIAPYGAVAAQGLIHFDGEAGWTMTLNISRNGEISQDEFWEGGYTLGPDCTGELDGGARIVVVDDGNGFYSVSVLEGGFAVYEVGTRIHTGPGNRDDH